MLFDAVPIGALLFAWCTLTAVAPIRQPRRLATLAWLSSCAPNEIPFLFLSIVAVSIVPALATGDVSLAGGWVGLVLGLVTVAGLGVVARRAWLARPALDSALRTGLGPAWRDEIDPAVRARRRRRLPWFRILLMPWPVRPLTVEKHADLAYGDDGEANRLDVYRRRSRPGPAPTLIHLHGGHFRGGRKSREGRPLLHHLASQGWTCISANYRLSPTPAAGFPGHLVDVKRVIAWARKHADEYGIDPGAIFLSGSSAGAHLTAMAALTPNDARFQPGFEAADTSVAGAIAFYGHYGALGDEGDHQIPTTPLAYDAACAPPFLVVHGGSDTYTPVEGARALAEHLRATSAQPVVLAELPGAQHAFDLFHSVRYEAVVDATEAFAAWVRSTSRPDSTSRSPDEHGDLERNAVEMTAIPHRAPRSRLTARFAHPALGMALATATIAACGNGELVQGGPTTTESTSTTTESTSTTTESTSTTTESTSTTTESTSTTTESTSTTSVPSTTVTTSTDGADPISSPADIAATVATAWLEGDDATVHANAEVATADLLAEVDPGGGPWSSGDCEGAAGSTYCQFDSPAASLTLRVVQSESSTQGPVVADATLTATGDAVALWPFTTAEEARNTQRSVDEGHSPWHLQSDAVVLAFGSAVLGYEDPVIDDAGSEGETTRVSDGADRSADVAARQPARTGEGGIWAVVAVTDP
jgi:acetyl esterase/lipase